MQTQEAESNSKKIIMFSSIQEISKRRSSSVKHLQRTGSAGSVKKYSTLSHQAQRTTEENLSGSLLSFFEKRRASSRVPDNPEEAMARLDEQINAIRGNLVALSVERETLTARVSLVRSRLDSISSTDSNSRMDSTDINEELVEIKEKSFSEESFKRDSGFVFDPEFEVDSRKISIPNNTTALPVLSKKARSTTALDFIKNDLYSNEGKKLKSTSIDRLSCYSDSAVLGLMRTGRHYH
uniref:Uncharacterized protein n=1 Tax=Amphimedon queenslandica TaxID=400682 RepID=A0A1X7UHP8_AMPQE